jgi:beta-lactamase class A
MLSASIAKLYILEVLLLQHHGKPLDATERALATHMIEQSGNDAANALYVRIGQGPALRAATATLGVHHTVPGTGIYWGFNETCAADYVALLRDLVQPGTLSSAARAFALDLLAHVEADQRWGVSAAADAGTLTRQKNGWLAASPDQDRWVVNSVGIITAHGRTLLVAVLTQHGADFASGVTLVQQLAKTAVRAIVG